MLKRTCCSPLYRLALAGLFLLASAPIAAIAAGGPLGIDHRVNQDESGIWARRNQVILQDVAPLLVIGTALWEGDDSRLGHVSWKAVDSLVLGVATAQSMKRIFSRSRPSQTDNPNSFFQGGSHNSFPSGEVMEITTLVTPYVLEYGKDHPMVWALELLPLYDSVARVQSRAHWQTDVLASFVIGSGIGYYAHSRSLSLSVGLLPHGFSVGWKKSF